jgi:hypothetical protein
VNQVRVFAERRDAPASRLGAASAAVQRGTTVSENDGVKALARQSLLTLIEGTLVGEAIIGVVLLLASMGDPGPGALAPAAYVQLLPLSGFIVIGASVVGIRGVRAADQNPRGAAVRVLIAAALIGLTALWVTVGSRGDILTTLMLIGIVALVLATVVLALMPRAPSPRSRG